MFISPNGPHGDFAVPAQGKIMNCPLLQKCCTPFYRWIGYFKWKCFSFTCEMTMQVFGQIKKTDKERWTDKERRTDKENLFFVFVNVCSEYSRKDQWNQSRLIFWCKRIVYCEFGIQQFEYTCRYNWLNWGR